ncbi:hypothetical protein [Oceanobacillus sp. FSL H7-0719]
MKKVAAIIGLTTILSLGVVNEDVNKIVVKETNDNIVVQPLSEARPGGL